MLKRGVPYLPYGLTTFPKEEIPEPYHFGVEIYMPKKDMQAKYFKTEQEARDFLAQLRELQKKALLYTRIVRNDDGLNVPGTGRIRQMEYKKGKMYCNICNDYTEFDKKYGWEDSDAKHCQYCSISDNDWYIKGHNGLWEGMKMKR
jgi:hypothetical protein